MKRNYNQKNVFRFLLSCSLTFVASLANAQTTVPFSETGTIQSWTVPAGVTTVTITAIGAQGGGNGNGTYTAGEGATVQATCTVTPGHTIEVVVGAKGISGLPSLNYPGSGGGGTFIWDAASTTNPLVVAGGGGGEGYNDGHTGENGAPAGTIVSTGAARSSSGGSGTGGSGGDGGAGGSTTVGPGSGAGGGGWSTNGSTGGSGSDGFGGTFTAATGGNDRANGFSGGTGMSDPPTYPTSGEANGGYGGGGGGAWDAGGGGGGYNGGGGGSVINYDPGADCIDDSGGGGGGGGSYINSTYATVIGTPTATNLGNGSASIKYIPGATLSTTASTTANVTCHGGDNGDATATPSGGTTPYTYSWTNGTSTASTSNPTGSVLSAGTYTVTVTDNADNTATASVVVTQPALLTASIGVPTYPLCNGEAGSATASATGGTTPYTYAWTNSGGNGAIGTGLTVGTYTVTIHDANNCSSTASVIITQPNVLTASIGVPTYPLCNGEAGSATASATGGTTPYTYAWTNSGGNGAIGTGLTVGTYTVTIHDANNCSSTSSVTITQPNVLTASIGVPTYPLCNGEAGSATASATGGTTPYTYAWTNSGGNGATGTGLTVGTYTVTIHDANNCSSTASVIITQPNVLTASIGIPTYPLCNGEAGSATASATGGTTPYTYAWTNSGGNGATGTGLTVGTYTVTIHDANNCSSTASVIITQPNVLTASIGVPTYPLCNGEAGSATASATGGTTPYTYAWTNSGGNGATGTGLTVGTYTVTIHDANNCSSTASVIITQPNVLTASIGVPTYPLCNGEAGSATASATGGTTPYTYAWTNSGGNGATGTGLTVGTYTVTIHDANNCSSTASITITQPNLLSVSTNVTGNATCITTGSATSTVTGGTTPYTYSWSGGAGTNTNASGLVAGTYTVTVHDNNGCSTSATATITEPANTLGASASTTGNVSCNGLSNGSISSNVTGGASPYTYSWSGGAGTNASASGLIAGTYSLSVTDNNGCTSSVSTIITQPNTLNASVSITDNVSCNGLSNGIASSTVTGGTTPYTYAWSDGSSQTTANASGLSEGTYTVSVEDNNGCTSSATAVITQPNTLSATANTTNNVSCNGLSNGSASSTVTGGTTPYTYSWSGSAGTNANASGLSAGTYTVSVEDNNGCSSSTTAIITQPNTLSATASTTANVSCNGSSNGIASSTVTGGTTPYTYLWSGSAGTNANASGLSAGTYTISVEDNNGCTSSATAIITQPNILSATASTTANVSCNGLSNGIASSTVTGGTTPYTYSWSGGSSQTTANASGLSAGTYTVSVEDNNGCSSSATAIITQPNTLSASASTTANVSCNGLSNGIASSTVTGGTTPYTYSWSGGSSQTTANASGLSAGTYTVSVEDNNGCTSSATAVITQPNTLSASASTTANVSCNGLNNGSASSSVTGGTSPYTYSWSGGSSQTTANASGLSAGTYTVSVEDNNGCASSATAIITQPNTLIASASTTDNVSCNGLNNGIVSSSVTGGTSPYTYSWSGGSSQTTANASGLSAGTYTVSVEDNNGCTSSATAVITQPNTLSASASTMANLTCYAANNGSASSTVSGGTLPYTYLWSGGAGTNAGSSGLSAGTYTLSVKDNNGCTSSASIVVTQPNDIIITANTTDNVTCNSGSNGVASSSVSGGISPYTYAWSDGSSQTTADASGLSAGTYTVVVTDNHGCTNSANTIITQPNVLSNTANVIVHVTCRGSDNGSAAANAQGGTLPYTYSWSTLPIQTTATATGLSAGTYTITIHDACGDISSAAVIVTQPNALLAFGHRIMDVSCHGGDNGKASVYVTDGTKPYTYSWAPLGKTTDTITGLSAGSYTVTVTDSCGSSVTSSVIIIQPYPLGIDMVTKTNVSCHGDDNGSASCTVTGGTAAYTYSWSPGGGTKSTATGLSAGTYTVTVRDSCGSSVTASVILIQPSQLGAYATTTHNVSCYGDANGSASSTATGGTTPYTYSWSGGGGTKATANGLSEGTYTVTVKDSCGSSVTATVIITQPAELISAVSSLNDHGGCTGSAWVSASGGTAPYTYLWTTGGQTTDTISNQCHGTYCCTITDNNGCIESTCVTIGNSTGVDNVSDESSVNVYPDPSSGYFTVAGVTQGQIIELYNYMGQKLSSTIADNETMYFNITNEPNGIYLIRVENKDGSIATEKKMIKAQ